jgi:hypothetical protein
MQDGPEGERCADSKKLSRDRGDAAKGYCQGVANAKPGPTLSPNCTRTLIQPGSWNFNIKIKIDSYPRRHQPRRLIKSTHHTDHSTVQSVLFHPPFLQPFSPISTLQTLTPYHQSCNHDQRQTPRPQRRPQAQKHPPRRPLGRPTLQETTAGDCIQVITLWWLLARQGHRAGEGGGGGQTTQQRHPEMRQGAVDQEWEESYGVWYVEIQ